MPLDLDKAQKDRAARRAAVAEREVNPEGEPIIFGGRTIAHLPAELPWGAIKPLEKINDEIALILRQALQMQQGGRTLDGIQLVLDLLASSPNLPVTLIEVIKGVSTALLSEEGLAKFLAANPSLPDIGALAQGIFEHYGTNLGESSRSVDSSASDGPRSEPTSSGTSTSTPAASSEPLALPASSESSTS